VTGVGYVDPPKVLYELKFSVQIEERDGNKMVTARIVLDEVQYHTTVSSTGDDAMDVAAAVVTVLRKIPGWGEASE
jgi:hypothetical protein